MTINVTVVVGQWVGNNRVNVLRRYPSGSKQHLATLGANEAHHTYICDGEDLVIQDLPAPKETSDGQSPE